MSVVHTFENEPGVGFFVRGDAGLARTSLSKSTLIRTQAKSDTGFGFLGGAGYGIALSDSTRLLFEAGYTYMRTDSFSSSTISIFVQDHYFRITANESRPLS